MKHDSRFARLLPPLITFLAVLALHDLVVRFGLVQSWLVPPPADIFRAIIADGRDLWLGLAQTALSALSGFALSSLAGILLAVLLASSPLAGRALYPYAVFFQTVPIIAIAPLLVILFGYGMRTVIVSAFIVSVFPVIANTMTGLRSTDPALVDLFRLYRAGRRATLWKLRLPAALPAILTGLRIAAGLAVIGAIVGEFVASTGLGSVVDKYRTQQRTEVVYAAVLLASLLGLAMVGLVNLISRLALRHWHPSE